MCVVSSFIVLFDLNILTNFLRMLWYWIIDNSFTHIVCKRWIYIFTLIFNNLNHANPKSIHNFKIRYSGANFENIFFYPRFQKFIKIVIKKHFAQHVMNWWSKLKTNLISNINKFWCEKKGSWDKIHGHEQKNNEIIDFTPSFVDKIRKINKFCEIK